MKKTISITLAGRIFQIEEDGFAVLEAYLEGLARHYANDASVEELLADIESGIAEKCAATLNQHKAAVTLEDVQAIIAVMGTLEEISKEDGPGSEAPRDTPEPEPPATKQLYRDMDRAMLGGVCAGLAAYFGITVALVRIVFLVLALINGVGILAYIIFWIAIPEAVTQAEKYEMHGKPLNVDEIEQTVKEKAKQMEAEAQRSYARMKTQYPTAFERIGQLPGLLIRGVMSFLRGFVNVVLPVLSVVLGTAVLVVAIVGVMAVCVIGSMLLFPSASMFVFDVPVTEIARNQAYYVGVLAAFVLAFVPLLLLIEVSLTMIRRRNAFQAVPLAIMIGLWILAGCAAAVTSRELAPTMVRRIEQTQKTSRGYEIGTAQTVVAEGNVIVRVTQGEPRQLRITGSADAVNRFAVEERAGVLTLSTRGGVPRFCLGCSHAPIEADLTLPVLASLQTADLVNATVKGFRDPMTLEAADASRIEAMLLGQSVTTTVQDVARVEFTGRVEQLDLTLRDASQVVLEHVIATAIDLVQYDVSHAILRGESTWLTGALHDAAQLDVRELSVPRPQIRTQDISQVQY